MSPPYLPFHRAFGWLLGICLLGLAGETDSGAWGQTQRAAPTRSSAPTVGGRSTVPLPQRRPSPMGAAPMNGATRQATARELASSRPVAGPSFPYEVVTVADRTAIRSAPSDEAYATDWLGPDTVLQVWRHDPNGWLAIRPPQGSFALIEAKNCAATDNPDVFTVAVDRTKAWVGTRIDEDHAPIAQVRLKLGEPVAVISSLIIEEEGGPQTWYQIEPPSGEFRWVHSEDLRPTGRRAASAPNLVRATPSAQRPQPPADGPMSGYMPHFSAGASGYAIPGAPGNQVGSPNGSPTADFSRGEGLAGQVGLPPRSDDSTAWRAAQQVTPALSSDSLNLAGSGLTPADNPLAFPGSGGSQAQTVSHGSAVAGQAPPASDGGFVRPIPTQQEAAPGDLWDMAVNRLRQDPIASALSTQPVTSPAEPRPTPPSSGPSAPANQGQSAGSLQDAWKVGDWNQRLATVQARLVRETTQPSQQWNLLPLLDQCRELWHSAPSPLQQEAAANVGRRVEEFLQLQQSRPQANDLSARAGNLHGGGDPWAGQRLASTGPLLAGAFGSPASNPTPANPFVLPPGATAELTATPTTGTPTTGTPGLAFDAVGYLKELIMARGQRSSEYVLQDETGRSICHLAAQPGVNLHNYLDKKVGVIGTKGFHGKLQLPHVAVERIYPVP